ncbi:hypothetical protein PR202_gb23618 [Eleusine coracana subsp. coracana]|uniref:Reverse transcriptase zinc-binding domain-containing protein n=1 Tax=Eleusine coracana subsp. coracana TaxID=191504 RepID=A0AAV5FJ91_ELECO|nr:hypothetical protein PR202_gb23618 [Eleusine coracana subsp. coracana]
MSVGDGNSTLIWTDNWLHGSSISVIAPRIFMLVLKQKRNKHTVKEALLHDQWTQDIRGALGVAALAVLLVLVNNLDEVQLSPDVQDEHKWRFSESGQYSAKSAYTTLFIGATQFQPWQLIWKSWAPSKCQFFMWLALHNRCWTADHLAKRGLPHPERCGLCDQEEESMQHLLIGCVVAKKSGSTCSAKLD